VARLVDWFGVEKLTRLGLEEELELNPISNTRKKNDQVSCNTEIC
jgi:hypothetical protein